MQVLLQVLSKLFNSTNDGFTVRVANNIGEAASLVESGFEYVTANTTTAADSSENASNQN